MKIIKVDGLKKSDIFLTEYVCEVYPKTKYEDLDNAIFRSDISLNGRKIKDDVFVANGDIIGLNLFFFHFGLPPVLDILYEDENFLAIEKMPGVLTFDEFKNGDVNVYDMALEYMLQKGEYDIDSLIVPYLCYTLPKFAGGILLTAKNEEAYHFADSALKQRKISLVYEAIILGHPKAQEAEEYHYMDNQYRIFSNPQPNALPIVTRYKVLKTFSRYSKVEIELITIRKYQVYAHMTYLGYPILGDNIFGNKRINRKNRIEYENIWLKEVSFSLGEGHMFSYLNHANLVMEEVYYPKFILKKGRKSLSE
jgi:23S rRNA pseudouridine955/2504/2580 synthase